MNVSWMEGAVVPFEKPLSISAWGAIVNSWCEVERNWRSGKVEKVVLRDWP